MKKKSSKASPSKKTHKKEKQQRKRPEQLLLLSEEEQKQPVKVLDAFFDCYHLKDLREVLWDWLVAALGTDSGIYDRGRERSNLIFLYKQIELLYEAAYVIHKIQSVQKNDRKKKK
ncbi:hypothetical protein HB364_08720 [Pseudoflavitalea sp. X16]|uniref:hypothetical protein n=1 Tax=Paraflavitalea devenefica TaxID=2716334 RepID=UPI00141D9838|nr:hypothetical protein [Paraflavitalea devenefica]NII25160.1 hypothetical protein [Paraflavitalea devenefica]